MAQRRSDNCYSCQFWAGHGVRERGPKGDCHRFPPTITDRAPQGAFPITLMTDWCGEWVRHKGQRGVDEADSGPTLYDEMPGRSTL
jgi:hypothetical protein